MENITFSARAYCKIILHAVKYPHCGINGILLAKQVRSNSTELNIVDVIPLFHICLHVSPMSEVALGTVDQWASSKGMVIAGYYLANENLNDTSIDKPAHRSISEKIAENFTHALLVVIDNKEMNVGMNTNPLKVSQYCDGKWKTKEKSSINYEGDFGLMEAMYSLVRDEEYRNLIDFDNHLDNIASDWRNLKLNKVIEKALESQ